MLQADALQSLRDDIATTQSMIDQAQANFTTHKHEWAEDVAWEIQAQIDERQFKLELAKLNVNMLETLS